MNTYLACLWKTNDHPSLQQEALVPYLLRKPMRMEAWHSPSGHVEIHSFDYWPDLIFPKAHLFKEGECAVCFDGFPDTGSDEDFTAPEKFTKSLFQIVQNDIRRLQGEFSIAFAENRALTLFLNRNGSHALYYVDQPGYVAFSNRLPLLLQLPGISHELNPAAAQWLCYQGFTQCGVTAFKAVHKLPAGAVATVTPEKGLHIRPSTYTDLLSSYEQEPSLENLGQIFETHCNDLAGYLRRMHTFCGKSGMTFRLSGGKDSRVVLALLLHAGLEDAVAETYTSGPLYAPDVISAQDIIARTHLKDRYRIIRETALYEELRLNMNVIMESLNVTAGQLSVHDFAQIAGPSQRILLTGHQGLRDAWFRHCPTGSLEQYRDAMFASYFHDPLHLLGDACRNAFMEQYLDIFAGFAREEQAPLDSVAELHALREVQGTWAAAINVSTRMSGPMCSPLLHPRVCGLTLSMPKAFRKNEVYHFMAVHTMAPQLLDIPFANQQWFPDLNHVLKGKYRVPVVPPYRSSLHFPAYGNPFLPPVKMAYYNAMKPYMAMLAEKHAGFLQPHLSMERIRAALQVKPDVSVPELVCGMGLHTALLLAEYGADVFHQNKSSAIIELLNDTVKERVIVATNAGPVQGHIEHEGTWQPLDACLEMMGAPETGTHTEPEFRCVTGETLWAGVCWGGDARQRASVPCKPDTTYNVSMRIQGVKEYEGVNFHIAVYDQDEHSLCAPSFSISADYRTYAAQFTTLPGSTHLRVNLVKAKSPARSEFLVNDFVVNPAGKSREDLYKDAIERGEAGIARFVRELQGLQSSENVKLAPLIYAMVKRNRFLYGITGALVRLLHQEHRFPRGMFRG